MGNLSSIKGDAVSITVVGDRLIVGRTVGKYSCVGSSDRISKTEGSVVDPTDATALGAWLGAPLGGSVEAIRSALGCLLGCRLITPDGPTLGAPNRTWLGRTLGFLDGTRLGWLLGATAVGAMERDIDWDMP